MRSMEPQADSSQEQKRRIPMKWIFILLSHGSMAIIYGLRVNISLAIVAMITDHPVEEESECAGPETPHDLHIPGPKYHWTSDITGHLLSSYFYGYLLGMIPFAVVSQIFSAKWVTWVIVVVNIIGCFVTPLAAMPHWGVLMAVRIIQGLTAAASFPAMHVLIAGWSSLDETSIFAGVIYAGCSVGMVGSTLIAGFVTLAIGWENMFYIMGAMCVPWAILWAWLVSDDLPEKVTQEEKVPHDRLHRMYHKLAIFPAKEVFKSKPFWAIMVAHFGGNGALYCIITEVPTFMKKVLHKHIKENTTLSVIPYIAMGVSSVVVGVVVDIMRHRKIINTTAARRIGTSISMLPTIGALFAIGSIGCNADLGIMWISIAAGATGAHYAGYTTNHLDISPNYAGLLMGITNTVATVPGIAIPSIFGHLTLNNNTLRQWSYGFYGIAIVLVFSYIFYMIFVSGEVQPWNDVEGNEDKPAGASRIASPTASDTVVPPPPQDKGPDRRAGRGAGRGRGET